MEREKFSSRLGFILISAGCAIGLGNVWRFPYITGKYGGAAFVLVYLVFLLILGLPIMVMEFSVGRASQKSAALSFNILEPKGTKWHLYRYGAMARRLPGFPIVLHGSSSVPQEYVKMINDHGGRMPNAIGVPEEQLREAAKLSVCKINIDSDLRLAMTGTIRQFMEEHPDKFDPREYLKPARANIKELVRHKLVDVLGCAGKA